MRNDSIDDMFCALFERIENLRNHFLIPHISEQEKPDIFQLDMQAFCVLSHAAFEEYFESICIYMLEMIEDNFNRQPIKIGYPTLCLLHFCEKNYAVSDEREKSNCLNDKIRLSIGEQKRRLSTYAMKENHGIGLKYLRRMLLPIGVDIPNDIKILTSLDNLTKIRGAFAHGFSPERVSKLIMPQDAKVLVDDVMSLSEMVKNKILELRFFDFLTGSNDI